MIKWQKYFDKIFCINFIDFKTRHDMMEIELKRVDILDSPVFEWFYTYNRKFQQLFAQMLKMEGLDWNPTRISCILGHLDAVKKAYYSGCKNVLIIEDDERFLRNKDRIVQILEKLPTNYELVYLDKFISSYDTVNRIMKDLANRINDQFIDIRHHSVFSAGCYVLNREGMERMISIVDMGMISIFDMIFNKLQIKETMSRAISIQNVSVQAVFSKSQTSMIGGGNKPKMEKALAFQREYKYLDIDFDDYMMRTDGKAYYYGDYIEE